MLKKAGVNAPCPLILFSIKHYLFHLSMQIMQINRAAQNAMFKKWKKKYPPKIGVNYHIIYHIMSIADTSWHIDMIYRLWNNSKFNNSISSHSSNSKMLKKWYKLYEMKVSLENSVFYLTLIRSSLKRVVILVNHK